VTTLETPLVGRFATLGEAFDAAAEQLADVEAYVDGERRLTFGQWVRAAAGVAAHLADIGVGPGDVVAVMLPPSIDYAVVCAAAARLGAVLTGLNPRLGAREVEAVLARAAPSVLVVESRPGPTGTGPRTVILDRGDVGAASRRHDAVPRHRGRASDPAVIVWTSGTTGLPKGAWFDHDNLRAAVASAGVMTAPHDRRLASTPFAHAGYMTKLWEQLAWATTQVVCPTPWSAAEAVGLIGAERITVAAGVPTQWAKMLDQPELDQMDLGALRLGVVATAPAPPELVERVTRRLGCPLIVRYAMTEAPSITGTEPGDPPETLYRTVGRPQASVEIELRDESGRRVAPGEVGRVFVRSDLVMRGYWNDPALTADVLDADGWLESSDLGRLDPDGNLVLAGRAGDMYIRGGYNVYPIEVENVLAEHPAVDQAAVVGVPTPVIGETGVAFVVVAAGQPAPSTGELQAWCRASLADYKAPDRVVVVPALPLTPMLKVDKPALRSLVDSAPEA
jgi:acyl-CoA synthetase (AMP-forming)/AMP-acid ligase II